MKIAVTIPSYKRELQTLKLIKLLINIKEIEHIVICEKDCEEKYLNTMKSLSTKVVILNQKKSGIGNARKMLYEYADTLSITHVLMLDNDIKMSTLNFNEFIFLCEKNKEDLIAIDLTDYYTHNEYNTYSWNFSCVLMIKKELLSKLSSLSEVNYYEDKEIIYILNRKVLNLKRSLFTKLKKNDLIGTEDSAFGLNNSPQREKIKKKWARFYSKKYPNKTKTFIKKNGSLDFDFIYDREVKTLVFDGLDRAGKSTMIELFKRYDRHYHLTSDRYILSAIVFNEFKRGYRDHLQYFKVLKEDKSMHYFVFLCDYEQYLERGDNEYSREEFEKLKKLFIKYSKVLNKYYNIHYIDGSLSQAENLLTIQRIIYEVKR